jgi:hypothetical protein
MSLLSTAPAVRAEAVPAEVVRAVLTQPDAKLDFLQVAIEFDRLIDKNSDVAVTRAVVARLEDAARQMAGPKPSDRYKLAAVARRSTMPGPGITADPSPTIWPTRSACR